MCATQCLVRLMLETGKALAVGGIMARQIRPRARCFCNPTHVTTSLTVEIEIEVDTEMGTCIEMVMEIDTEIDTDTETEILIYGDCCC